MLRVLVSVGLFTIVFVYLTLLNPQSVKVTLYKGYTYTVPLAVLVVICSGVGFVVAYLFGLLREIRLLRLSAALKGQNRAKEKLFCAFNLKERFSHEESKRYLEEIKTGKDPYLLAFYGRLLRDAGDVKQAKEIHSELKVREGSSVFVEELLKDLYQEGRYSEVVAIAEDTEDRTPGMLCVALDSALSLGDYERAGAFAEELFRLVPTAFTESLYLGVKCEGLAKKGDIKGVSKILKKRPGFVPAIKALVDSGNRAAAVSALKEAYKKTKDPTYLFWLVNLVVKEEGGDPRKTMEFIGKVIPEEEDLSALIKGYLFVELGMYEDALKALDTVKRDVPLSSFVRAMALKGMGRYQESVELCAQLIHSCVMRYTCKKCDAVFDRLYIRCPRCKTYDSVRLEV